MAGLRDLADMLNSIFSPHRVLSQFPLLNALLSFNPVTETNTAVHSHTHTKSYTQGTTHCPPPSLSCPSPAPAPFNTNPIDECCLEPTLSGHFLSTQFWDTSPPLGPKDSWTLHGLWPDHCTGGFEQYCDNTRTKSPGDLERILGLADHVGSSVGNGGEHEGEDRKGLLGFMCEYWVSMDHRDANLWAHEWNKHGTCISTLKPECYDYGRSVSTGRSGEMERESKKAEGNEMKDYEDILDYFVQATVLFAHLDTFAFLERADIIPSYDRTYALSDIEGAIKASFNEYMVATILATNQTEYINLGSSSVSVSVPEIGTTLRCNRNHELQEVWYHFLIKGPLRHARANFTAPADPAVNPIMKTFMPTGADGQVSNCPSEGVRYMPKGGSKPPHTTSSSTATTSTGRPQPTPTTPFTGRGHLKVRVLSKDNEEQGSGDEAVSVLTDGEFHGCLIRAGTWYASGACAAYTARTDVADVDGDDEDQHFFTLDSSYAPCAILKSHGSQYRRGGFNGEEGQFVCARRLPVQTIFGSAPSVEESGSAEKDVVLSYKNQTIFYADRLPGRFEKVPVFVNDDDGARDVKIEVHWEGL